MGVTPGVRPARIGTQAKEWAPCGRGLLPAAMSRLAQSMNRVFISVRAKRVLRKVLNLLLRELPDPLEPYSIRKHIGGVGFDFLVRDRLAEQWYRDGDTLGHKLEFTGAMVSLRDVVFEVGAHHGFTTIPPAHWSGENEGCSLSRPRRMTPGFSRTISGSTGCAM